MALLPLGNAGPRKPLGVNCYHLQVAAPNMALKVWDMAIQVHGAAGVCSDTV
ncbi:hypothetical protein F2Q69_00019679 [Brassica cretica]|uniref:Acyl-CoA dehydrogenase/oxidase C-terminal domain-containing protein n=1 Tax=Brassica cretica TaxID=69181 RepID=A0A8S9QIP7_BRACR|nr:hypothetical protein F2Q69_00019679 [Brassica cretica]